MSAPITRTCPKCAGTRYDPDLWPCATCGGTGVVAPPVSERDIEAAGQLALDGLVREREEVVAK